MEEVDIEKEPTADFRELFQSKEMLLKVIVSIFVRGIILMSYNGLSIDPRFASDDIFLNCVYMGLIEIPAGLLSWYTMEALGRRLSSFLLLLLTALLTGLIPFLDFGWLRILIGIGGKLCITTVYGTTDVLLMEMFPTSLRARAVFLSIFFAEIGGMLAPQINTISKTIYYGSGLTYCILTALIGIAIYTLLPETRNCPLPQTTEQANQLIRGHEKEYCDMMQKVENVKLINQPTNTTDGDLEMI